MAIILSTQADVTNHQGANALLDAFGDSIGVPGLGTGPTPVRNSGITADIRAVRDFAGGVLAKLRGRSQQNYEPSYVESGKQLTILGGTITESKPTPLEEGKTRTWYSQSPNVSVIIKKREFSGLRDLYKPELMDPSEKWLMRATKRLVARKCAIMADYERLTKIAKLADMGASSQAIMRNLMTSAAIDTSDPLSSFQNKTISSNPAAFDALNYLEKISLDRQPPGVTTYFVDPTEIIIEDLGIGHGAFEITTISTLSTNLDLDGGGSCSFSIEDPYRILLVTEEDIETSLRETALSQFVNTINSNAASILSNAQQADAQLNTLRRDRGVSPITFTADVRGGGARATVDAIGFSITEFNIDDVPPGQELNAQEQLLFTTVITGLRTYSNAMLASFRTGTTNVTNDIRKLMDHARERMRVFYLGKSIIQSMDSVHVYISGGTRRSGEGEEVTQNQNIFTLDGAVNVASSVLGASQDQVQIDEDLIREEYDRNGNIQSISFDQYLKIRAMEIGSGMAGGLHVFGGLVKTVSDRYSANDGKHILSVNCMSNLEWIRISRYNTSPSLDQTQGIVYDPLTPFDFETDPATGLPTGKMQLSQPNRQRLSSPGCNIYFGSGPGTGQKNVDERSMAQDTNQQGGRLSSLFEHSPGLVYKWKKGIMTITYDANTTTPKNKTLVSKSQLRRDVGFFASNTPFDNMDSANIISVLVTGHPYNATTFVQSALQTGAYIPDTALNSGADFFHSFFDVQRSLNRVQGNFLPFSAPSTSPRDLAEALSLQQQLTKKSSRLSQLRTQEARLVDKITFLNDSKVTDVGKQLTKQLRGIRKTMETAENEFNEIVKSGADLGSNVIRVAGDDVSFDLFPQDEEEDYKRFGDRLVYSTLRKREDVIYNKDKNFLIISNEYDKDYDIQAFALRLRDQSPNLWKGTWQSAYQLCTTVAENLNFEFFCNTQGHIEFRPPQYNRTPRTVFEAMLALKNTSGVQVFPKFLVALFQKRENSLIRDIKVLETEIKLQASLLAGADERDTISIVKKKLGVDLLFLSSESDTLRAVSRDKPFNPNEKQQLLQLVQQADVQTQIISGADDGLFSSVAQSNIQKEFAVPQEAGFVGTITPSGDRELYERHVKELVKLTGKNTRSFPEFDKAKVGVSRNGQSTPATDISNIISKLGNLISRRSRLLKTLGRVLQQNIQVADVNEDGNITLRSSGTTTDVSTLGLPKGLYNKLIADDRKNLFGHMSGDRFIVKDEHIKEQSFQEAPPQFTSVTVTGTDPLVGESNGNIAGGIPLYLAYGVDYDLWRQYGWRSEKSFDKPFFWSAELQCAPYAVMLLSRQRKNVITGSVKVIGNEYYQLGDVVYVTNRQLLYYVHGISHSISYDGDFSTTLTLKYGHAPGDYIPSPLDVIGKSLTNQGGVQGSFRVRRQSSEEEQSLATIKFNPNSDASATDQLLAGSSGQRNFNQLVNAAIVAKANLTTDPKTSPRIIIMTYTDDQSCDKQMEAIKSWFNNPRGPALKGATKGPDGASGTSPTSVSSASSGKGQLSQYRVGAKFIRTQNIRQCSVDGSSIDLTPAEKNILRKGFIANDKAYALSDPNNPLKDVVEIRLRKPPAGGWED